MSTAGIRNALDEAKPLPRATREIDPEPDQGRLVNGIETRAGDWKPDMLGLPPDCPVKPLGIDGKIGWFMDPIGQLQNLEPPYGKGHLLGLFGGRDRYLSWAWPRHSKKGIDGYAAEHAAACLINSCFAKGQFSLADRVRGSGAWRDKGGNLVLHVGDRVLIGGKLCDPGEIGDYVYTRRPALERPWGRTIDPADDPALVVLPLLRKWNWARPHVDPVLMLGWIGVAFLSGALPWRPAVFVTGDKATGKSTLQRVVKAILGDWLVQSVNTTAAGIYQKIGHDSRPVALDEMEAKANSTRSKAVLELARQATSGGVMLRGGDKHQGVEFEARSAFLFSAINAPPLEPQDLSRLALLRLMKSTGDAPLIDEQRLALSGQMILRRLIDNWSRLPAVKAAIEEQLARGGHDKRGQDTFGTLLALASLIVGENFDELHVPLGEDLSPWGDLLKADSLIENEDALPNWLMCLNHLLTVDVEAWRDRAKVTLGQVAEEVHSGVMDVDVARGLLNRAGLGLHRDKGLEFSLFVPNVSPRVRVLYDDSKWAGEEAAGAWSQALRQAPEGVCEPGIMRINGVVSRGTMISLKALYGPNGVMAAITEI